MELKELSNTDQGINWVGPEINHGDFPFRFVLKLEYTDYISKEMAQEVGEFMVSIYAVSVEAAAINVPSVLRSMGMSEEEFKAFPSEVQYEILADSSLAARLYHNAGNEQETLLATAREELAKIDMFFGCYMDKQQNAIGATGWDFIRGEFHPQPD